MAAERTSVLAFGWFAWQVAPHYVRHYLLEDDVAVVARAPVRDDPIVRDRLRHAVQSRGLEEHIDAHRGADRATTFPPLES